MDTGTQVLPGWLHFFLQFPLVWNSVCEVNSDPRDGFMYTGVTYNLLRCATFMYTDTHVLQSGYVAHISGSGIGLGSGSGRSGCDDVMYAGAIYKPAMLC